MTTELMSGAKRAKLYRARRYREGGEPFRIDADEVGKIVDKWTGFGFASTVISRAVGVTPSAIRSIRRGRNECVDRHLAQRIEALTSEDLYRVADDDDYVSAIGVTRRAQAAMVIGHPAIDLIPISKIAYTFLSGRQTSVHMKNHRMYARRYRELVMSPGDNVRARRRAAKLGYPGPLAWSAESIDDPWALPEIESDDILSDALDLVGEVESSLDLGMDANWIARDLAMRPDTIARALATAGRDDLVERLRHRDVVSRRRTSVRS